MKRFIRAAFLLTATLASMANAHAQGADDSAAKSSIAGNVVDSITDQPIKGARISLRPMAGAKGGLTSATTNADGQFDIGGLSAGRYLITASQDGYVNQRGINSGFRRGMVMLTQGQRMDGFTIRLTPGAIISGRITNEAGKPVPGVSLQLLRRSYTQGRDELLGVNVALTDEAGDYRINNLGRGKYYLRATYTHAPAPAVQPATSSKSSLAKSEDAKSKGEESYVPLYYPGTSDLSRAVVLALHDGEELSGINLHLTAVHTFHIRGRATNAFTTLPVKGCQLTLVTEDGKQTFSPSDSASGAKGAFDFPGIPAGSYILMAELQSAAPQGKSFWGRATVEVSDHDVNGVEAVVGPGADISGRLHVEGDALVDFKTLNVELEPRDAVTAAVIHDDPNAAVKPDGTFLLHEVAEGSYEVDVLSIPPGFYLKSNGADILTTGLTVGRGNAPASLELTLSKGLVRIEGTVSKGDQASPGVTVVLAPDGARRTQSRDYRQSMTDASGKFTLRGVPPGDYKLWAGEGIEIADFLDPESSRQYEDQGKTLHIDEDSHSVVQLEELGN